MQPSPSEAGIQTPDLSGLRADIDLWARELGFQEVGVSGIDLWDAETRLLAWIEKGYAGEMQYFERHGATRARPADLVPGTVRIISVRMNYLTEDPEAAAALLDQPDQAYISRYALGRDYHKVLRARLQLLCDRIREAVGPFAYRVFTDSAPVMEVELATQAGIGWRGKHTLLLNREAGSWFFLGEIYTDLPLPISTPVEGHCGSCEACIDVCPTGAIVGPYEVDARRCISYLTIEHPGAIPASLRPYLGNRIYGCDDCQLVCPWNKFAKRSVTPDFAARHGLDRSSLLTLFAWSEAQFLANTEGSTIRRIGYERWLRNIAVALGNAPTSEALISALQARASHASPMVREHVLWALARHEAAPIG